MTEPLIEVRALVKHFPLRAGTVRAVDGVDFEIDAGKTLALVGESGCGKSTTGQAAIRLIEPTSGSIRFDGVEITKLSGAGLRQQRRYVQIVFQDPFSSLDPRMRVGDIIAEPLVIHRIGNRQQRADLVAETLDTVGLSAAHAPRFPHQFSGGQRQRIGIARALVSRPKLIVCDEAVSSLDVSIQAQIINLLKDLQQRFGLAYLFISHNLAVVRQMSDAVAVMYLGKIVETAPREEIFAAPRHPYTQALLAAVPVIGRADDRAPVVRGELPDPTQPPPGCAFHPRCPIAIDRCRHETPLLRDLGGGTRAACHLAQTAR